MLKTNHTEQPAQTPAATALCHLEGPFVFLASQTGDSQLLSLAAAASSGPPDDDRMDIDGEVSLEGLSVLDTWSNIGPVHDFVLVQDEGGASAQVVTASGETSSGSLRTIRSGLGLEDVLTVEGVAGVDVLFTLVSERYVIVRNLSAQSLTRSDSLDKSLVIASSPAFSTAFSIAAGEQAVSFEPARLAGLDSSKRVLAAAVLHDQLALVINEMGFAVTHLATGQAVSVWTPENPAEQVVLAACSKDCAILAFGMGNVRSFIVNADGACLESRYA